MYQYRVGSRRIRRGFVLWKTVNGETKWLQIATWQEEYVHVFLAGFDNYYTWRAVCWLSESKYQEVVKSLNQT
jgi:hypothetical protein